MLITWKPSPEQHYHPMELSILVTNIQTDQLLKSWCDGGTTVDIDAFEFRLKAAIRSAMQTGRCCI